MRTIKNTFLFYNNHCGSSSSYSNCRFNVFLFLFSPSSIRCLLFSCLAFSYNCFCYSSNNFRCSSSWNRALFWFLTLNKTHIYIDFLFNFFFYFFEEGNLRVQFELLNSLIEKVSWNGLLSLFKTDGICLITH